MLKKDSPAWQLAMKRARRKGVHSIPVALLADGRVRMQSNIRGNTWVYSYNELLMLEKGA